MRGHYARVGAEIRETAPELPLIGGPYVPSYKVQAAVKAVRIGQVLALGAYFLGESLFASSPKLLALLGQVEENRLAAGVGLYLTHLGCEMAYSTAAFEVSYNGHMLFSKMEKGRFPQPGEIARELAQVLDSESKRRAADSHGLVTIAVDGQE